MNTYQESALRYLESGLGFPIPSAFPYEKHPPLGGWTGRDGAEPDEAQVRRWMVSHPDSNLLVRMAPDVIGIDVDQYDDKHGADTLATIERKHHMLPLTPMTTARDLPSGIYWFRLSTWMDTDKMRDPGKHIEVIRYGYRYACAPPSWHPGARARYRWMQSGATIPTKDDLASLPLEWYIHLNRGCECFEVERAQHRAQIQRTMNRPKGEAGSIAAREDLAMAAEALKLTAAGSRNNMLSSIAGRFLLYDVVLNGVLTELEVVNALWSAGVEAGLEQHEIRGTIRSAREWAIREGANR